MNTMQQEFDAVVQHLYTQGQAAFSSDPDGPGCYYRQPNTTNKCAVGCRIPDDVYDPAMDKEHNGVGTGIDSLIRRFGHILPPELTAYKSMFSALQTVHDSSARGGAKFDFERMGKQLANVAHSHGVVFTEPKRPE